MERSLLTRKQIRLLALVRDGYTDAEIATELGIARQTVKNDLVYLRTKLQARNRVQAVTKALRRNYIKLGR